MACTGRQILLVLAPGIALASLILLGPITTMIYAIVLAAIWLLWRRTAKLWPALILVAAFAAAITMPPWLAERRSHMAAAELAAGDVSKPLPQRPQSIEFAGSQHTLLDASCNSICQWLLITGQAQTVGMRLEHADGSISASTYRVEQRSGCSSESIVNRESGTKLLPSVEKGQSEGRCIVETRDSRIADGVSVRRQEIGIDRSPALALTDTRSVGRVTVSYLGETSPLMRRTEVRQDVAALPLRLQFGESGLTTAMTSVTFNPHDQLVLLSEGLGYNIPTNRNLWSFKPAQFDDTVLEHADPNRFWNDPGRRHPPAQTSRL